MNQTVTMDTLSALIGPDEPRPVALSKYHDGQMVRPVVLAANHTPRWNKRPRESVIVLAWYDSSDRSYTEPLKFAGTTAKCEAWLREHGVRLDSQGIH